MVFDQKNVSYYKVVRNFVKINLALDPDPDCIRTNQQQAGSGSGLSDYRYETMQITAAVVVE
jgi:hypothetical protein